MTRSTAGQAGARLAGKVALVTGAAQGIGQAVTEAFATEGARVIATDLGFENRRARRAPSVEVCLLDVTDEAAIQDAARRHADVDVLVNCAGWVASGSVLTASREDLDRSFRVNVGSVFSMTRAFVPGMLERKRGSIINIASVVSSVKAAPDRCAYAASKGAVIALTKSVALDLAKHGIRCNAISPGTIFTPSLEERIQKQGEPEAALRKFVSRQPIGRLGKASEVAAVAVLLASDDAEFITGSNVIIDGGFSL